MTGLRLMQPSPGACFFDTNVVVYAHDPSVPHKRAQARMAMAQAMRADECVISTQVMQEFYNVVLRKRLMTPAQAVQVLAQLAQHTVVCASAESVLRSIALQQRHRLSIWDALVVQAALDAHCAVLYSEDLQAGQGFEATGAGPELQVVNPFTTEPPVLAVHEPRATYHAAAKKRRTAT